MSDQETQENCEQEAALLDKHGPATLVGNIQSLCAANADFTPDTPDRMRWVQTSAVLREAAKKLQHIWKDPSVPPSG